MERIYSPWRSKYIQSLNVDGTDNCCFICDAINSCNNDKEFLVVARRDKSIIMMNKFPYNSGHLLVCPVRHISDFNDFSIEELTELMSIIKETTAVMKDLLSPQGFNIGINVGVSAGAGLPSHLHFHIVPRWSGDCNFIATIGDCKIISESIEDTRTKLYNALNK